MLTITDLSLQRGGVWLLESVDLTVQPGQRVAIVGANGAGKSSLFQLFLGQLAPEQGLSWMAIWICAAWKPSLPGRKRPGMTMPLPAYTES